MSTTIGSMLEGYVLYSCGEETGAAWRGEHLALSACSSSSSQSCKQNGAAICSCSAVHTCLRSYGTRRFSHTMSNVCRVPVSAVFG